MSPSSSYLFAGPNKGLSSQKPAFYVCHPVLETAGRQNILNGEEQRDYRSLETFVLVKVTYKLEQLQRFQN